MKLFPLLMKILTAFLVLSMLLYMFFSAQDYFASPQVTTIVYHYVREETVTLSGYMVRKENLVPCDEPLTELIRSEGERVAAGSTLAMIYRDEEMLSLNSEAESLRRQIEQLQKAYQAAMATTSVQRTDVEIRDTIFSLRTEVSAQHFSNVNELTDTLRTLVLQRSLSGESGESIAQRISALNERLAVCNAGLKDVGVVSAPVSGMYTAETDGFETVLTVEKLETISVEDLNSLAAQRLPENIGKVIEGQQWYIVASVDTATASRLSVGKTVPMHFTRGVSGDYEVKVQRIGESENGRAVVVLQGNSYIAEMTYLRYPTVELVLYTEEGLRVPQNALRVNEKGDSGVYCLVGRRAYFKPVEIIYQGEGYSLVKPGTINSTSTGTIQLYTIRQSDQAIISSGELYDGKVVE